MCCIGFTSTLPQLSMSTLNKSETKNAIANFSEDEDKLETYYSELMRV